MKYEANIKLEVCPNCGSARMATIVYGTPEYLEPKVYYLNVFSDLQLNPDIEKKIKSGEIELGGCIDSDKFPSWRCKDCRADIYKLKENERLRLRISHYITPKSLFPTVSEDLAHIKQIALKRRNVSV